jgi:hypothetical protein
VDWIELAEDGNKWLPLVNTVINVQFSSIFFFLTG